MLPPYEPGDWFDFRRSSFLSLVGGFLVGAALLVGVSVWILW